MVGVVGVVGVGRRERERANGRGCTILCVYVCVDAREHA